MTYDSCDDIDKISNMFREIFETDIVIVKASDDGIKYTFACPGFCVRGESQNLRVVTFDTSNNTIIHNDKVMEFNDEALEYLQSLKSKLR